MLLDPDTVSVVPYSVSLSILEKCLTTESETIPRTATTRPGDVIIGQSGVQDIFVHCVLELVLQIFHVLPITVYPVLNERRLSSTLSQ